MNINTYAVGSNSKCPLFCTCYYLSAPQNGEFIISEFFQYFSHLFPPFFQSTSPPTTVLLSMLSSLFSTQSGRLPFLCFTVGPLIFTPKYLPYMLKSRATLFSTCSTTRSALVGGGGGPLGGVEASLASCVFLIRQAVYPANPIPDSGSQSGSLSRRGLGSQDSRITCE